jgi:hypothetical protein
MQFALAIAAQKKRFLENPHGDVVAWIRELFFTCNHHPIAHEDFLFLHLENSGIAVNARRRVPRSGAGLTDGADISDRSGVVYHVISRMSLN